jgi:hypothetical protein
MATWSERNALTDESKQPKEFYGKPFITIRFYKDCTKQRHH